EQGAGFGHEASGDFEEAALASGEPAGVVIRLVREIEGGQQLPGALGVAALLGSPQPMKTCDPQSLATLSWGGQEHVLQDGAPGGEPRELEGSHQAAARDLIGVESGDLLALELPGAGIRPLEPGED